MMCCPRKVIGGWAFINHRCDRRPAAVDEPGIPITFSQPSLDFNPRKHHIASDSRNIVDAINTEKFLSLFVKQSKLEPAFVRALGIPQSKNTHVRPKRLAP